MRSSVPPPPPPPFLDALDDLLAAAASGARPAALRAGLGDLVDLHPGLGRPVYKLLRCAERGAHGGMDA